MPVLRHLLCCCILSFAALEACPQGLPQSDRHLTEQLALIPAAESVPEQFATILQEAGIPGGIVSIYGGCTEYPKRAQPVRSDLSVSQALDALVREDTS